MDTAIKHLADDFEFHVKWKPFLLNSFLPEGGIPVVDYFKLKFGEEAAAKFLSGATPVSAQAKSLVSYRLNNSHFPQGPSPSAPPP